MRFSILKANKRSMVRGGAVLLVAGMAAGCSSGVSRFGGGGVDDIFTASTPNQRSIISQQQQPQPYPGETQAAPLAASNSGSVSRGSLQPVSSQSLPAPAPAPVNAAQAPALAPAVDRTTTATVAQAPAQPTQDNVLKLPGKKPLPANQQPLSTDKVAVLPQQPKAKAGGALAQIDSSADKNAKPAGAGGSYKVAEGDTLNRIANKLGVTTAALKQANGLQDGRIRIGQSLKVPGAAGATVAKAVPAAVDPVVTSTSAPAKPAVAAAKPAAEAPTVAAYTPPKKDKLVQQAEESAEAAPNATGIDRMRWPVRGRVVASYGKGGGKSNDGIDISVPEGTPVKAAENGVVIYAGDGLKEFGNTVLVRHENGLVTVYGHASELKVQRGQKVKRGDEIALSGMSGSTDAPKLHFEVRKNSTPVDPSGFLE
ncbi:peptidoglycan DD-metalloendopeptidase family protein [Aminobacter aganoensis]|uniref:Murein DD-endopeptidase MepM/ murein hydrolase activator NlpD n=1 Tax=Aminobacter aganoensis TaxID=83264 RepID=A0A7X0F7U6_9HYPH|nr:M23 family metallopeptidase [Aminobacter aganoensis]MBB6354664.1 murein DD-endopeptidase MepM/ murein hydrolase activator NlpD [Aminobacter aganoensis]